MHLPPATVPPSRLQPSAFSLQPSQSAGFTLLELLVVVSMMIFITTIAAVNYFGVMRAAGYTAVSNDVFNALLMARQRACIDNKPVYFYLLDATNYVMMESFGTLARVDNPDASSGALGGSQEFYDQYVDSTAFSSNMTLLDIDAPGTGAIVWKAESGTLGASNVNASGVLTLYSVPACFLHVTNNPACTGDFSKWTAGDHYGTPIFATHMLPKGFAFSLIQTTPDYLQKQAMVLFQPDGTVDIVNNLKGFMVFETLKKDSAHTVTFSISSNGAITQQ